MALFLYGTLMDVDVMAKVLDPPFAERELVPAVLPGWRRLAVRNATYPVILPDAGASIEGRLLPRVGAYELARIRHFESEEYVTTPVRIRLADGSPLAADVFVALDGVFDLDDAAWDLGGWQARHKTSFLQRCGDWMRDFPVATPT